MDRETDIIRLQTAIARLPGEVIRIKSDHTAHENDINARLDALFEKAGIADQVNALKLERMGLHQQSQAAMEKVAAERTRLTSALEVLEQLRAEDDFAARTKDGQVIEMGQPEGAAGGDETVESVNA